MAYHKNLELQRLPRNYFETVRMEGGQQTYNIVWEELGRLMDEAYRHQVDYIENVGAACHR